MVLLAPPDLGHPDRHVVIVGEAHDLRVAAGRAEAVGGAEGDGDDLVAGAGVVSMEAMQP
ncbi:hypothetical protein [Streptomyces sp. NBC_00557]|uniref:hypothetical protein n=1 Tax=Streptomyces sp. NBC_00557 TaxID=2975776 RepID=UPI002E800FDF|nr:hypothetical protein [Streptomyces sp. NBC_00557]WUC36241.1 hypothetical protein OG956_19500 [Streptomyces sp. NBC_00557]